MLGAVKVLFVCLCVSRVAAAFSARRCPYLRRSKLSLGQAEINRNSQVVELTLFVGRHLCHSLNGTHEPVAVLCVCRGKKNFELFL